MLARLQSRLGNPGSRCCGSGDACSRVDASTGPHLVRDDVGSLAWKPCSWELHADERRGKTTLAFTGWLFGPSGKPCVEVAFSHLTDAAPAGARRVVSFLGVPMMDPPTARIVADRVRDLVDSTGPVLLALRYDNTGQLLTRALDGVVRPTKVVHLFDEGVLYATVGPRPRLETS